MLQNAPKGTVFPVTITAMKQASSKRGSASQAVHTQNSNSNR